MAFCNENTKHAIKEQLVKCLEIVHKYEWLHNTLLHDYFVENHWKSLPPGWQSSLHKLSPVDLANFLNYWDNSNSKRVPTTPIIPLELLALKSCVTQYSINRRPVRNVSEAVALIGQFPKRCKTSGKVRWAIIKYLKG